MAGLFRLLRMDALLERLPPRPVWAAFVFVNGFVTIGLLAALAWFTATPFVFPSLGPTAFLFFYAPHDPSASPRNALLGHAIAIGCGYGALLVTGLASVHGSLAEITLQRGLAVALSMAATGALMILARSEHTPAGATTLIVSLGLLVRPLDLLAIEGAVALLVAQSVVINRLAGVPVPLWSWGREEAEAASRGPR